MQGGRSITQIGAGGFRGPPGTPHLNHVFTPLCPEHAPRCCFAKQYVPSLHCAVASWGALAGGSCVGGLTGKGRLVVAAGGLPGDARSAAGAFAGGAAFDVPAVPRDVLSLGAGFVSVLESANQ